ncbi:MAG: tail fiber protein [Bacteroidota bacterium]
MEGTIGEIRLFASNFAPKNWAYCAAQVVQIRANTALFSILGTTYGGDGSTTFMLPDLQGRVALGAGQGAGLTNYALGAKTGTETVVLDITQLPAHNHQAVAQPGIGSGTAKIMAVGTAGGASSPGGNYIGQDTINMLTSYASGGTIVGMDSRSVQISNVVATGGPASVALGNNGGNLPHSNLQPYTALNYIICMYGIFPSRN